MFQNIFSLIFVFFQRVLENEFPFLYAHICSISFYTPFTFIVFIDTSLNDVRVFCNQETNCLYVA